jgi:hypothetical protein
MSVGHDGAHRFPCSLQETFSIHNASAKGILLMVVNLNPRSSGGLGVLAGVFLWRCPRRATTGVPGSSGKSVGPLQARSASRCAGASRNSFNSPMAQPQGRPLRVYEQKGGSAFLDKLARADDTLDVIRMRKADARTRPRSRTALTKRSTSGLRPPGKTKPD